MIERIESYEDPLVGLTGAYVRLGKEMDLLKAKREEIKKRLIHTVEHEGVQDDKGHEWLELPEDVEGVYGLQRQHRVKRTPDEEAIERILGAKPSAMKACLLDECTKVVHLLDEDAVMAAHARGEVSDAEIEEMFPATVTYAFVPVKR